MNTQDLNERAAKAAGITVYREPAPSGSTPGTPPRLVTENGQVYDPHGDDVQSAALAATMGLVLKHDATGTTVEHPGRGAGRVLTRVFRADAASLRDAIVRVAVAVGEQA